MLRQIFAGALAAALLIPGAAALPAAAASLDGATATLSSPSQAAATRGQVLQLLYEGAGRPAPSSPCPFSDVPAIYQDAAAWAAEQGYISGTGTGQYSPDLPLTGQELAVILYRMAGSPALSAPGLLDTSDRSDWAEWAQTAGRWAEKAGLLSEGMARTVLHVSQVQSALERFALLPDPEVLQADLEALTEAPRPIGSQGERQAVQYLEERFRQMGYEVTLQPYTDGQGRTGSNVIAVKTAPADDADILVLSAHHDSFSTTYGASDNASGVSALLAAAEALEDVPTDTEVRFISFTDEEGGKNGSRFYTDALTQDERDRMIGNIQFDMLGGLGASGAQVCTMDGTANWVSDLLLAYGPSLTLGAQTASDHASFQLAGVPSVLVTQDGQGYLYHSAGDTADTLDVWTIAGAAASVIQAAEEILSPDTPSCRALACAQGEGYTYCQTRQTTIYFGSSLQESQAYIGASGTLAEQWEISGDWWTDTYESYRYSMRWFGREEPLNTYYIYRNGYLDHIEIRPEETGCSAGAVQASLEAMYGAPSSQNEASVNWEDPIYSKYLSLSSDDSGCLVTVSNYSLGITNVLVSYPVIHGEAQITDPQDAKVWNLVCAILPQEARQAIGEFTLFTDGCSNVLAYTSPLDREDGTRDNSRFSVSIDYYDVYDENGQPRDWSKLIYTIVHEYGHVLLENDTQIDLTVGESTHDPAGFREGSFRKVFYDAFWAGLGDSTVADFSKHPTNYVSRYGANYFHEDIADTFAVFVFGGDPQGDTVAAQKLRFFAQDPDMAALREAIRTNLGLM